MTDAPPAVADALREAGQRSSAAVCEFFQQAAARGLKPDMLSGYIVYWRERPGLPPDTIRLSSIPPRPGHGPDDEALMVQYDGDAASARNGFADGLPFYPYQGRLQRGGFPPVSVVGEPAAVAAVHDAADLLTRAAKTYLETGRPLTSL